MPEVADQLVRLNAALVGHYRLERELGQGGMATVYLAEDLRHHRQVAIKVLRPELAAVLGGDRFVQEITTTAQLQHPHILPLFDSGTADGFLYYVMPYIEGETLRDKLNRETQLGIEESVRITSEIADALDYAHRHGVIHRDIKPENILLHDGRPVVADFGIALAVSAAAGGRLTETGLSLGTPHYMSPEQATAEKDITARSDVYSLGSVLYEMLAGQPPHVGGSAQQIIMRIIAEEAKPVTALRKSVPPNVAVAVAKALQKLPADRFETARAFGDALRNQAFAQGAFPTVPNLAVVPGTVSRQRSLALTAALLTAGGVIAWLLKPNPARIATVVRLTAPLPPGVQIFGANRGILISPDGSTIAFTAFGADGAIGVYVRELAGSGARLIAPNGMDPFFSPDGRWLAFYDGDKRRLMKVATAGGSPQVICDAGQFGYGDWAPGGKIFFANYEVWSVPESGGTPLRVTRLDRARHDEVHYFPQVVAGGKVLLFTVQTGWGWNEYKIVAQSLATGEQRVLVEGGWKGFYVSPGYLVYHRAADEELLAIPVDLTRLRTTGQPVHLREYVASQGLEPVFYVSRSGTLVYVAGNPDGIKRRLVVRSSASVDGVALPLAPRAYMDARTSPDGQYAAVQVMDATIGIWLYSFSHGSFEPLLRGESSLFPVWSRDSRRIAYSGIRNGLWGVYTTAIEGSGQEEELLPGAEKLFPLPGAWTSDGKTLVLQIMDSAGSDLWTLDVRSHKLAPLFKTPFWECCFNLSPDGRWIAYTSTMSGHFEVYLQAYPSLGRRWQVSKDGGDDPRWSPNGRKLYYFNGTKLMAVDLGQGPTPDPQPPRLLFEHGFSQANEREWDIMPDGKRFLLLERTDAERPATQIQVVLNWSEELKRRLN